jgi:hypothetical protein
MDNKDTLQQLKKKIKIWWEAHENDLFLMAVMVLIFVIMVGFLRLIYLPAPLLTKEGKSEGISIEENAFPVPSPKQGLGQGHTQTGKFVASINGVKYYPAGCKTANRIKEENRMWFASEEEAKGMGYERSTQC